MSQIDYPQGLRPTELPKGNWIIENGSWVLKGVMSIPLIPFVGVWKLLEIGNKLIWKLDPKKNLPSGSSKKTK